MPKTAERKRPGAKQVLAGIGALGIAAVAVFGARPLYHGLLNAYGYCLAEERFLTHAEMIESAVSEVIRNYPPTLREGSTFWRPKNPIGYADVKEFFEVNGDCCWITSMGNGYSARFLDRIQGRVADFVRVGYLVRYRDDRGVARSEAVVAHVAISNCGRAWSGI